MSIQQLPLMLRWPEHVTFENFLVGQNTQVLTHLSEVVSGKGDFCTYLYALNRGLGLTHLLQASCHAVTEKGGTAAYLSLKSANFHPDILDGMESLSLLCLDDIEIAAGNLDWELALFNLYHRLQETQTRLMIAAHEIPKQISWKLPDLQSRFLAGVIFQVHGLLDEEKIVVLQQRAAARSLDLSEDVGKYLLNHYPRDMHALTQVLDALDTAALSAQRRLTVPFVKIVLNVENVSSEPDAPAS